MDTPRRIKYEPPRIRDLSALNVFGQRPEGSCEDGSGLTSGECKDGSIPEGGTCYPNGFVPNRGYCRTGDKAVEGCTSGSIHH